MKLFSCILLPFSACNQIFRIENDPKLTPTISFRTWISVCAAFKWFMVQFSIIYCPPDCLFSIWIAVLLSLLYCYVDIAGFHTARARYRITLSNLPKSVKMLHRKITKYAYVASRHQAAATGTPHCRVDFSNFLRASAFFPFQRSSLSKIGKVEIRLWNEWLNNENYATYEFRILWKVQTLVTWSVSRWTVECWVFSQVKLLRCAVWSCRCKDALLSRLDADSARTTLLCAMTQLQMHLITTGHIYTVSTHYIYKVSIHKWFSSGTSWMAGDESMSNGKYKGDMSIPLWCGVKVTFIDRGDRNIDQFHNFTAALWLNQWF